MSKLITLALAIIILTSGCYTILQHPDSEAHYVAEDYQADCLGCHTEYHEYPYGYFYGNYPDYWWSNPRWGQYYAYPWWWDNYWYDGGKQHVQQVANDDKGGNGFGRGRGYLNMSVKWLYSENLELEAVFKNLLNNREETNSFTLPNKAS